MKAFVDTPVTKSQLLESLERHAKADRIVQGHYVEFGIESDNGGEDRETKMFENGCALGCAVVDFVSKNGNRDSHEYYELFESLFGIPYTIAESVDVLFECMSKKNAATFPVKFVKAINVGANLESINISEVIGRDVTFMQLTGGIIISEREAAQAGYRIIKAIKDCKGE